MASRRLWVVSVLCVLRGGSSYLIEGGFGAREAVQPVDPFPGFVPRPTCTSRDATKSFWATQHVLGSKVPTGITQETLRVEAEFPDIASEMGTKLDENSTFPHILQHGKQSKGNDQAEQLNATQGRSEVGRNEYSMKIHPIHIEDFDKVTGLTQQQRDDLLDQLWEEEDGLDEWGNQVGSGGDSAHEKLLAELRLRDQRKGTLTARQLLDLGYKAYGGKARAALKAESQEARLIGDGRPKKEKPRSVSGKVRYTLIAGEQRSMLEDWMSHGMTKAVREELVMSDNDITEVGERTFVDKNGTMYVGLASPMHPMSQAAAKEGSGADTAAEGLAWRDVSANVTKMYKVMSKLYNEWEGRREAAGLVPCGREREREPKGEGAGMGGEEVVDPEVAREVSRMIRPAGRDAITISTDSRLLPWWLRRKLALLATPAREALRIASLLAVVVSFGAGVEYTNRLVKGPRRTTPRPVRTTTGLPY